ncbi:hypothetical protein B0J14DRAFT_574964 [Halenospora varia]|nr:hypothetical protein B0J14DRAFT_574964 [Halenospora varia]
MSNPSYGTKVTNPNAPEIREGAGAVASDSLAAESTRSGGGFADNKGGEPQGVSGANSTFANTNTSGATRLDPASDAEARMAQEDWAEEKKLGAASTSYPTAVGRQSKAHAVGYSSGQSTGGGSGVYSTQGSGSADTAPSYVTSQYVDPARPKGQNLKEGGFTSNDKKNASFNSEIGSKNDPGRLAEQKMFRANADVAGDAAMPRQKGTTGDNPYDGLGGETSA